MIYFCADSNGNYIQSSIRKAPVQAVPRFSHLPCCRECSLSEDVLFSMLKVMRRKRLLEEERERGEEEGRRERSSQSGNCNQSGKSSWCEVVSGDL